MDVDGVSRIAVMSPTNGARIKQKMGKVIEGTWKRSDPLFGGGLIVHTPGSKQGKTKQMRESQEGPDSDSMLKLSNEWAAAHRAFREAKERSIPSGISGGSDFIGLSPEEQENYIYGEDDTEEREVDLVQKLTELDSECGDVLKDAVYEASKNKKLTSDLDRELAVRFALLTSIRDLLKRLSK